MDDKPTKRGGGAVVAMMLVALLALLPMLYVLSIGPMVRLHHVGAFPSSWQPALETLYLPLAWTTRHVPVCDTMIGLYIGRWLPDEAFVAPVAANPNSAPVPAPPTTASP